MLALVTILLTTLLVAVVAVALYRFIFGWKGSKRSTTGNPRFSMMKLNAQQGYIALTQRSQKKARQVPARRVAKRSAARGGLRAPWGW